MALISLKEDLINEFRAERDMVEDQMELLDPLGTSLRKPAAQRLLSNTTLVITEYGCYGLFIGGIVFLFMASGLYPFTVLNTIYHLTALPAGINSTQMNHLVLAGYGLIALCTLFVLIIGRMAYTVRQKNGILHQAGKDIKIILGQHLERQAAIEAIQQRHQFDMPDIIKPVKNKISVHEVLNPGYEGNEDEEEEE